MSKAFLGKNIMMFVTASKTKSKKVKQYCSEGRLKWVSIHSLDKLKIFEDVKPILKHILKMDKEKIFVGTSKFDGKDRLISLDIKIN